MEHPVEITVTTRLGKIKGVQQPAHQVFSGIHYAQAPLGELRFQPPRRIDAWEGVFDATHYAPIAPQAYPDTPPIQLEESEDCLSLNIYTPAADSQARPVMVFIHGGGFLIDSGSRPRTYGGWLAEAGDVVVVTIEYRMGAFGFLYSQGISPNLGLQDQVCALQWVQRNISDFGGDPDNVTIFGESAGATSVAYLMVMPMAKGLFHKAILESGAFPFESQDDNRRFAEAGTRKFFKELGVAEGDLPALQNTTYAAVVRANKKAAGRLLLDDRAFYPVIDGTIIPEDVYGSLRSGSASGIPIIIGVNAEELPIFGVFLKSKIAQFFLKSTLLRKLRKQGVTGSQIRTLLGLYQARLSPAERRARREYNHLFSDLNFRLPATLFAEALLLGGNDAYFYCFTHPAARIQAAMHVMELYFVFGTLGTHDIAEVMQVPGTPDEQCLSQTMMAAWTTFARTGDPNHLGFSKWPVYDLEQSATMFLDIQPRVVNAPFEEILAIWKEITTNTIFKKASK